MGRSIFSKSSRRRTAPPPIVSRRFRIGPEGLSSRRSGAFGARGARHWTDRGSARGLAWFFASRTDLEIVGTNGTAHVRGGRIRSALGLREQLFVIDREYDETGRVTEFIFIGRGWGHGVGMCQVGAYGLAKQGWSAEQILKAYYSGIDLTRCIRQDYRILILEDDPVIQILWQDQWPDLMHFTRQLLGGLILLLILWLVILIRHSRSLVQPRQAKARSGSKSPSQLNGEIINCDSVQVYREIEIATAKCPRGTQRRSASPDRFCLPGHQLHRRRMGARSSAEDRGDRKPRARSVARRRYRFLPARTATAVLCQSANR